MAEKLLATVAGKNGVFDLSLLKIEAKKEGFRGYLVSVMREVYGSLSGF